MLEGGTRLRAEASLRSDVVTVLEAGRWLELLAVGELATVAGIEAPWLRVRDPWAPLGDGLLAGDWRGWVWGGLVGPAPDDLPEVTHALWDRLFATPAGGEGPRMWALRPAADQPGVVEVGEWTGSGQAPDRLRPLDGWLSIDSIHRQDPGNGRVWLWLTGRGSDGHRRGQLVPAGCAAAPLEVALTAEPSPGQQLRGGLYLIDLDGDGVDEALVQWVLTDAAGEIVQRHFAPFALAADGTTSQSPGAQVREALLPAPDLQVRAVALRRQRSDGALVEVTLFNGGARSTATRLDVSVAGSAMAEPTVHRAEVPALSPGQEVRLELAVDLGRRGSGRFLVEALVVPRGVEVELANNRLARWTSPD